MITHGSLFTGIGGFDAGFEEAGMESVWQVEKEPFCIAVLKTRFPNTERYYDVRKCGHDRTHKLRAVDVVSAGFPCQDLSVAGKRAGLEGARSGLFWEVVRILGELRPTWFVLENVPGLFSSGEGHDFAIVLNALDELGYGLAWRVLNSQFFGVAQRRRRVFIVGRFGKPCPAEVLFESESGCWDFAESGEAGEDIADETCDRIASPIRAQDGGSKGAGPRGGSGENLIAFTLPSEHRGIGNGHNTNYVAAQISASAGHHGHSSPRGDGSDNLITACLDGSPYADREAEHSRLTVCIQDARGQRDKRQNGIGIQQGGPMYTLDGTSQHAVASLSGIGSGGPDDNDGQAGRIVSAPADSHGMRDFAGLPQGLDSARYRALGNAVTRSVAAWIGRRIVERITNGDILQAEDSGR